MKPRESVSDGFTNFSRLLKLLVYVGKNLLRKVLDEIHPPSKLPHVLEANRSLLTGLTREQQLKCFPSRGRYGSSSDFDLTLTTVLLTKICNLKAPSTGWRKMPRESDTSLEANLVRMKHHGNTFRGHLQDREIDEDVYQLIWKKLVTVYLAIARNFGTSMEKFWREKIDELTLEQSPIDEECIQDLEAWYRYDSEDALTARYCERGKRDSEQENSVNIDRMSRNHSFDHAGVSSTQHDASTSEDRGYKRKKCLEPSFNETVGCSIKEKRVTHSTEGMIKHTPSTSNPNPSESDECGRREDHFLVAIANRGKGTQCVLTWCESRKRFFRPVNNLCWYGWPSDKLQIGRKYKFVLIDASHLNSLLPHKREDILVTDKPVPHPDIQITEPQIYSLLVEVACSTVQEVFAPGEIIKGEYIAQGVDCPSVGALRCTTREVHTIVQSPSKNYTTVQHKCYVKGFEFRLTAHNKELLHEKLTGAKVPPRPQENVLVLFGLARPDHDKNQRQCRILVIGIIFQTSCTSIATL